VNRLEEEARIGKARPLAVLHRRRHNPTGAHLSCERWATLATLMTDQADRGNGFTHIGTHESKNMSMTITLDAFIARPNLVRLRRQERAIIAAPLFHVFFMR